MNFVSFYDSLRFANWLATGRASGDTETGAYTLLGGSAFPSNGDTVTRNAGARIFLPSEDEWYKAAYYDASPTELLRLPGRYEHADGLRAPTATANSANCGGSAVGDLTNVGSYTGSASPYGTFDQGGNVWEWNEALIGGTLRGQPRRGVRRCPARPRRVDPVLGSPSGEFSSLGFRVAMVPEPGTGVLMMLGMLGLARWRRPNA